MDVWSGVICKWLNAIAPSTPGKIIEHRAISLILNAAEETDLQQFISKYFPKCQINAKKSPVLAASLLLLYISYSQLPCFDEIRQKMCQMEESLQVVLAEYLHNFEGGELAELTVEDIKEGSSAINQIAMSPAAGTSLLDRSGMSSYEGSPLQLIFQTPLRTPQRKVLRGRFEKGCHLCRGGEKLVMLQRQASEDDVEKNALTKQLQDKATEAAELGKRLQLEIDRAKRLEIDVETLESDLAAVASQKESILQTVKQLKSEKTVLREDLEYANKCLNSSSREVAELTKNYCRQRNELESLKRKHFELKNTLEETQTRNTNLERESAACMEELNDLKKFYAASLPKLEDSVAESLERSYDQPENMAGFQCLVLQEEITSLKCSIEAIAKEKAELEKNHQVESEKFLNVERELTVKLLERDEKLQSMEENIQRINLDLSKLSEAKEAMRKSFAETVVELQGKLTTSEMELKTLAAAKNVLAKKIKTATSNRAKLEKDNQELKESMERTINDLNCKLTEKDKEIAERTQEIDFLSKEKAELAEKLVKVQDKLDCTISELTDKEKEIMELMADAREAETTIKVLQQKLTSKEKAADDRQSQIMNLLEERNMLKEHFEKHQRETEDAMHTLKALATEKEIENGKLNGQIKVLEQHSLELKNSTESYRQETENAIIALKAKIASLKQSAADDKIEMEKACTDLKSMVVSLQNSKKDLSECFERSQRDAEEGITKEKAKNTALETCLSSQRAEMEHRCSELQMKIEKLAERNQVLDDSLARVKREAEETLADEIARRSDRSAQQEVELERLKTKVEHLEKDNQGLNNFLERVQRESEEIISEEKGKNIAMEIRVARQESEKEELAKINQDLSDSLKKFQREADGTLADEKATSYALVSELKEKVENLERHQTLSVETEEKLKTKLLAFKEKSFELERELEKDSLEFKTQIENLQKENRDLEMEKREVAGKLEEMEKSLKEQIAEKEEFERLCLDLKCQAQSLEKEIQELQNSLEKIIQLESEHNLESTSLKCELQNLKKENKDLSNCMERLQKDSNDKLHKLETKNRALEEVKSLLFNKVHDLTSRIPDSEYLNASNDEVHSVLMKVNAAVDHIATLQSAVQRHQEEKEELNRNLQSCKEALAVSKAQKDAFGERLVEWNQSMKRLLNEFNPVGSSDTSGEGDQLESLSNILDRISAFMEVQGKKSQDEKNVNHSELHSILNQKRKVLQLIDSMKPKMMVWKSPALRNVVEGADDSFTGFIENCKSALVQSSFEGFVELDQRSLVVEVEALSQDVTTAHASFVTLVKYADKLHALAQSRSRLYSKLEEEYESLEERTIKLTEINSRLSKEITKSKALSAEELKLKSEELASYKESVASLNKSVEELRRKNQLLHDSNAELSRELSKAQESGQLDTKQLLNRIESLQTTLTAIKEAAEEQKALTKILPEIMEVRNATEASLNELRSKTPEMRTAVAAMEQRVANATTELLSLMVTLVASTITSITPTKDGMNSLKAKIAEISGKFESLLLTMKKLSQELKLAEVDNPNDGEILSDSLEEIPVVEKTFEIVNLHDDTFALPPAVSQVKQESASTTSFVISPPSRRRKQGSQGLQRRERVPKGEVWVIPPPKHTREESARSRSVGRVTNKLVAVKPEQDVCARQKARELEAMKALVAEKERAMEKEREQFEASKAATRQRYEKQLEQMKREMKQLYNEEVGKHKQEMTRKLEERAKAENELKEQNKMYKEHIDDLKYQVWELSEKLLQEQKAKKELEDRQHDLSRQLDRFTLPPPDWRSLSSVDAKLSADDGASSSRPNQASATFFPAMHCEDEEEVFDNHCLDELKAGQMKTEDPSRRLTELQIRNSLCLPHLKSSYPAETQFLNPRKFSENELKSGNLNFGCDSQSVTDSSGDPSSMTRSLLPDKGKKKEQTSYKKPGPPTPSKLGRLSLGGEPRTPKRALREQNTQDKGKGTPSRLKALFTSRSTKRQSVGGAFDENSAPTTPRSKRLGIFQRKPFGGREF